MDVGVERHTSRLEQVTALLFAFLVFLTLRPYFIWHSKLIYGVVILLSVIFSLVWIYYNSNTFKTALIIVTIYVVMIVFSQFTIDSVQPWMSVIVPLVLLVFLFNNHLLRSILNNFINIYVIFMVLPIVMFILISLGLKLDWEYFEPYSKAKQAEGIFYRQYFGMVILNTQIFSFGKGELFRLSGVYPEPGVVGTLSALILSMLNYNLRKLRAKIIFISGILSFSLAFYVLSFIYLIVKKPIALTYSMVAFIVLLYSLPVDLKENRLLKYYFFERIEAVLYDFESVDNREDNCFKERYTELLQGKDLFLGKGYKASIKLNCDTSSYKTFIYDYGLINFTILLLLYIIIVLSKMIRYTSIVPILPFLLICIASSYQRPALDQLWFIMLFVGGLATLLTGNSTVRNQKI